MLKKLSTYWMCQLGGWGANLAISEFFYLTLSTRKIDHFFLLIFLSVVLGILFSHLMRLVIKEYKFLQKPLQEQIFSFIAVTFLFAVIYGCTNVALEKMIGLKDTNGPKISLLNEITRNAISDFFLLFILNSSIICSF